MIGASTCRTGQIFVAQALARCAKDPYLRHGLKLHFGNSAVDYRNVEHVRLLKSVFRAANDFRMPIVVHIRASITEKLSYGREEALVFLNEIVPAAPAVPIQIAHLAGAGGYSDPAVDQAMSVFIDAISASDARTKQLWFDVTSVALGNPTPEQAADRNAHSADWAAARCLWLGRGDFKQFAERGLGGIPSVAAHS